MSDDYPSVEHAEGTRLSLTLGQRELPYEWTTPDHIDGGPMGSKTRVQNGESYDPPLQTICVYNGTRFWDATLEMWLTIETFRFHRHIGADELDPTWYVDFEEEPPEGVSDMDPRFGLSEHRFAGMLLTENLTPEWVEQNHD